MDVEIHAEEDGSFREVPGTPRRCVQNVEQAAFDRAVEARVQQILQERVPANPQGDPPSAGPALDMQLPPPAAARGKSKGAISPRVDVTEVLMQGLNKGFDMLRKEVTSALGRVAHPEGSARVEDFSDVTEICHALDLVQRERVSPRSDAGSSVTFDLDGNQHTAQQACPVACAEEPVRHDAGEEIARAAASRQRTGPGLRSGEDDWHLGGPQPVASGVEVDEELAHQMLRIYTHVDKKLRVKIWCDEYVDFGKLIRGDLNREKIERMEWTRGPDGRTFMTPAKSGPEGTS